MAKGKKKETLTPEERLQAALVPESKQPYKLPENWCWVKFGQIIDLISGRDAKLTDCNNLGIGIPYILGASNLENNVFTIERWIEKPQVVSLENDILLSVKGTIGKTYLQREERINISRQIMSIRTSTALLPQFTYWLVNNISDSFRELGNGLIPGISREDILQKEIPLSPLPEQQRIVERIESLFAKLDEAKQKAQDALDSFETRKAAILHKAFTGELTAQWRKEHGETMESWEYCSFENCILKMQNGLSKRSSNSGTPFIVVRLANLSDDGFITDDLRKILLDEKEEKNYSLKDNDVLMIRVNGSKDNVGKQFLFSNKQNWAFCDHIIRITYKEEISPAYMVYFSKTNVYRRYIEDNMVSSAGQNTISRKGMASLFIPIPLLIEQTEIVRILDDLLAKEQQAKEAAEGVLEQIDLIKKAILARAFRGELGTNDPKEESAVELLKQVLSC